MAGSLNKVILIGRIGADAELKYLPNGSPVANFNIATSERWKDKQSGEWQERTDWHRVCVFGSAADFCSNYLGKGRLVYVEGQLKTRKWQDRDGQDRYTTEVVVAQFRGQIQAMDNKNDGQGPPQRQQRPSQSQEDDMGPAFPSEASGMDDVPF